MSMRENADVICKTNWVREPTTTPRKIAAFLSTANGNALVSAGYGNGVS